MFPTIDVGSIGALVVISNIMHKVVSVLIEGTNFIAKKILIVIGGSKIWATAFFLGIALILVGLISTVLSKAVAFLGSHFIQRVLVSSNFGFEFCVINQAIPLHKVLDCMWWILNFTLDVYFVERNLAVANRLVDKFMVYVSAFKT